MSGTGRPMGNRSDPKRYDRIQQLVGEGQPDSVIVKKLVAEFKMSKGRAYVALRLFERETREMRNADLADRRVRMITQLEQMQVECREIAKTAHQGFEVPAGLDANGQPRMATTRDPKAAAMAMSTAQQLTSRIIAVDGLSVEAEVKAELYRLKLLEKSGLTPAELEKLIGAEVAKKLGTMSADEVEAMLAAKRGE